MFSVAVPLLVAVLGVVPQLPDYLQQFQSSWEQESALTDGLRGFDREHAARIDALMEPPVPSAPDAGVVKSKEQAMEEILRLKSQVRTAYEMAIGTYPNNARLHNFYGELLYDYYDDIAGALKAWHQALSLDDKLSAVHNNLALHNFRFGEYKTGLKHLDLALKYDKTNPDYLYNISNLYLVHYPQIAELRKWDQARVYKEAMKYSKKAVKEAPEDYDIVQDYAVNFFAAENFKLEADWEEAATAWQGARAKARNDGERFYCWLNEGRVWLRAKQPEKAIPCLEEALKLRPDSAPARELLDGARKPAEAPGS